MRRPQSRPYHFGYERSLRPCLAPPSTPRQRGLTLKPALRDRPLGKVALLLGVLLLALAVSRSCASTESEISKDEAIEIARREVDYRSERTVVRLVRRGVPNSRPYWAVSLSTLDDEGRLDRVTVVLVDARTREIAEIRTDDR